MNKSISQIILISILFLGGFNVYGQVPNADFWTHRIGDASSTVTSGCPPLILQFNDLSTFNSAPIPFRTTRSPNNDPYNSHQWFFDDKPPPQETKSTVQNPVFGYFQSDTFNVMLVVTPDGVTYDTIVQDIITFALPVVGFSADVRNGCNPLTVQFTDLSTSQGDSIVAWQWDFCDGALSSDQNPVHTFHLIPGVQRCFCVTLTVTNSRGCSDTRNIANYICIDELPVADFAALDTVLCSVPYEAQFFDQSTVASGNVLSHFWDFGDGSTSNNMNPIHTYAVDSVYSVKLVVTDTDCGEKDSITKLNYILAEDLSTDFTSDITTVCAGGRVQFTNLSNNVIWNFGDGTNTSSSVNPSHIYTDPGTYDVTLISYGNGGCPDTTIKAGYITVNPLPIVDFYSDDSSSCQAPFTVNFFDASIGAVDWEWNFGLLPRSFDQNPTFTYQQAADWTVTLTVTNAFGCKNSLFKPGFISIEPVTVRFGMDTTEGCACFTTTFTDSSFSAIDPIIGWEWENSNGIFSYAQNPSYTFCNPGIDTVTLTIETTTGCQGSFSDVVKVGQLGYPNFLPDADTVCVNEEILFTNLTVDTADLLYKWDFNGDGSFEITTEDPDDQNFAFDEPGTYCVTLEIGFFGCTRDTCINIVVLHPRAEFDFIQDCINPSQVEFIDQSERANIWKWYFGDGDSLVNQQATDIQNPTHIYLTSGIFDVRLVVANDTTGCETEIERQVTVSTTDADFQVLPYSGCINDTVYFRDLSNGTITGRTWNFGDGSTTANVANPFHVYTQPGVYDVTLTIEDVNECEDTETKVSYITIHAVYPDFASAIPWGCLSEIPGSVVTISFDDLSTTSPNTNIASWDWDFGDTQTSSYSSFQATVDHDYSVAQIYTVSLTVTNDQGCSATETKPAYIDIAQPQAAFELEFYTYCVGDPVPFINNSTGRGPMSALWYFGDGQTSTAWEPVHTYNVVDTFDVILCVTDTYGCQDCDTIIDALTTETLNLGFGSPDTVDNCPPHTACFQLFANITDSACIRSILWNFGDGSFSSRKDPCHVYTRAGSFTVTLEVEFCNYCSDSITLTEYINIGGARGNITIEPDTGCSPLDVVLDANSQGATSHFWVFGAPNCDPPFLLGAPGEDTISYTYCEPGIYTPSVIMTDSQIPVCTWTLPADAPILVDTVYGNFGSDADTICRGQAIQFYDSSTALIDTSTAGWTWRWNFGDGDTSHLRNPIHVYEDTTGLFTVQLIVTNSFGCSSVIYNDIYVRDKPTADFMVSDTSGCDRLAVNFTNLSIPGLNSPIDSNFWYFADTTLAADTLLVDVNMIDPVYEYLSTGNYWPVLIVKDVNGCADTATRRIDVWRSPVGILNPDTMDICAGDAIQLLGDTGFVSYQWTPGVYLSDSTIVDPVATPPDSICYSLYTEESHGCDYTDTVCINVIPLPPLSIFPYPDTVICLGDTIRLAAQGGDRYIWGPGNDPAVWFNNTHIDSPLVTLSGTRNIFVFNVDTLTGCRNRDTMRIIVNEIFADFVGEHVCLGDSTDFVDFSYATELPVVNWLWDFGDTNDITPGTVKFPSHTYTDSGFYRVQLIASDINGCSDTIVKTIAIDHPPVLFVGYNDTICFGDSVQLYSSGGDSVYWTPPSYISDPFDFNPMVKPVVSTNYVANIKNGVCPFEAGGVQIMVIPLPFLETDIDSTTIIRGRSIELTTKAFNYDSLIWTPGDSLSCVTCLSPIANPHSETTYRVQVFNEYGCKNEKYILIEVDVQCDEDMVFVPNAFTPNGDDINDVVYARPYGVRKINYFRVFDRWGRIMFETEDITIGWDGTDIKGQKLNTGVYVYMVEADCFFGKTFVKSGNITLIK